MAFPTPFYRWRPHPWHGLSVGPDPPRLVHVYIEITPFDLVKYEVDKVTGYLRVDRPQRTSSQPPALYGFIPRTYGGRRVAALSEKAQKGDGDPLDICVVSERPINRSEIVLIAVLQNDNFWGGVKDISELPPILVERLRHYFGTYKLVRGEGSPIKIEITYGLDHALKVVEAGIQDYDEEFGG
jgi:inorganic pyrophosphatase